MNDLPEKIIETSSLSKCARRSRPLCKGNGCDIIHKQDAYRNNYTSFCRSACFENANLVHVVVT